MYRRHLILPLVAILSGCAGHVSPQTSETDSSTTANCQAPATPVPPAACIGDTSLPASLAGKFEPVDDPQLLQNAVAGPGEGKLCQGQVYQAKAGETITIYRGWNSRNDYTRLGSWWAADMPAGVTTDYRTNYEICYKWSPLDRLVQCQLKPGTKVVVGTGQSVACSPYPDQYPQTYILPVSASKQVYLENADDALINCVDFDNNFNWQQSKASQ